MKNVPSITVGIRGEYRARLYDENGIMKHDSGWNDNLLLDQGPWQFLQGMNNVDYMTLGTSDVAAVSTQTGIQGTILGRVKWTSFAGTFGWNWSTPPYYGWTLVPFQFNTGVATGTIKEFVLAGNTDSAANNDAAVRVVLTAPIVKGPFDQLIIEYRLYTYPEVANDSGTFDVSGVNYDIEMGWSNIDQALGGYSSVGLTDINSFFTRPPKEAGGFIIDAFYINGVMPVDIFTRPTGTPVTPTIGWEEKLSSTITNGTPPYRTVVLRSGVDEMNGTFDMFELDCNNDPFGSHWAGRTFKVTRTSDSAAFTKEDTHVVTFTYRLYLDKYVP